MANAFYYEGINQIGQGGIDLVGATIKAALVSSASYTPNLATDDFLNDIAGGAIIAAGVALTSKSFTGSGVYNAANTTWTSVSGGAAAYIVLYKDTGSSATSNLIALYDTATGLPVTPNGGDITAAWAAGSPFTLCERLSDRDRSMIERLRDWMAGIMGIPARHQGGLWIPEPRIVMG